MGMNRASTRPTGAGGGRSEMGTKEDKPKRNADMQSDEVLHKFQVLTTGKNKYGSWYIQYRCWFRNVDTGKVRRRTSKSASPLFKHCVDELAVYTEARKYIRANHPTAKVL